MAWDEEKPADADTAATMMNGVIANWAAIETVCGSTALTNFTPIPDYFPVGTRCFFYADSAPAGWTIFSSASDELLAIKGGSVYDTGAKSKGTWQQPDHTLTEAEMPAHTHTYTAPNTPESKRDTGGSQIVTGTTAGTATSSTGSGSAHNHGSSYRYAARVGIICTKDTHS